MLNVYFNIIFCIKYQTPRGRRRGDMWDRGRRGRGWEFEASTCFFSVNTLWDFSVADKYYELYIEGFSL